MTETKKNIENENRIDTVIADDINFRGTLRFKKSLKIKGTFEGKIEAPLGHLLIGREATIKADINTKIASISGIVNGKIKAKEKVQLQNKSKIYGDIITPNLAIESGSVFNGTCLMDHETAEEK